jgi:cytochrome c oxidase cbb3-type subunit III
MLASGCSGSSETAPAEAPPPAPHPPLDARAVAAGRVAYVRYCALCHGDQAQGYAADHAPALSNANFLAVADDAFLMKAIADGRQGTTMSAWHQRHGGPLSDVDVGQLTTYLRSLASRSPASVASTRVSGSRRRGEPLFAQHCASCHGARGEGSETATSLSHPSFLESASDGYLRFTIEQGRPGTPMVAWNETLSSQQIDDLVLYIRTLSHMPERPVGPSSGPPPAIGSIVINPSGENPSFELREERYVPADAVKAALDAGKRMIILDARATSDWALAHIVGAAPFPFYDVEQMTSALPKDETWILAYCACPHGASGHVVDTLRQHGYEHTAVIDEGIRYWQEHGYPLERGELPAGAAQGPTH